MPGETSIYFEPANRSCENYSYLLSKVYYFLIKNNYAVVWNRVEADIIIAGSCCVTDLVLSQGDDLIQRLQKEYPEKIIIYLGCASSLTSLYENKNLLILNQDNVEKLDVFFKASTTMSEIHVDYLVAFLEYQKYGHRNDNMVNISKGCANKCSYCNIKLAKGNVVSKSVDTILCDIARIVAKKEDVITLLSDDCGSYGLDISLTLPELIKAINTKFMNVKIKVYNIHPMFFIRYFEALTPFIISKTIIFMTIPIQTSVQRILALMNRSYDMEVVRQLILKVREFNEKVILTTHVMLNFPTETMEEFRMSLEYAKLFNYNIICAYGDNLRTKSHEYFLEFKDSDELLIAKQALAQEYLDKKFIDGIIV